MGILSTRIRPCGRDSGEVGNRLCRVLFPGAGKSNRTISIQRRPSENHSRGHYLGGVLPVLGAVPLRAAQVELPGRIWPDGGGSLSHLQGVVGHDVEKERAD